MVTRSEPRFVNVWTSPSRLTSHVTLSSSFSSCTRTTITSAWIVLRSLLTGYEYRLANEKRTYPQASSGSVVCSSAQSPTHT